MIAPTTRTKPTVEILPVAIFMLLKGNRDALYPRMAICVSNLAVALLVDSLTTACAGIYFAVQS